MNGWTTERRQRQSQLIKQWQPWEHSTGSRTAEGKAKVSRNACKVAFVQHCNVWLVSYESKRSL